MNIKWREELLNHLDEESELAKEQIDQCYGKSTAVNLRCLS